MPGFLLLLFSIQYLHCLCCAVLFCLIVSLVYEVIDMVFIFRSLSTTSKKYMGTHIQWICPDCTDTSDTVSFRRKSPFSWIVTSRQKGFQSFPCSLYNINCTKCIPTNLNVCWEIKVNFCHTLFLSLLLWKKGKKIFSFQWNKILPIILQYSKAYFKCRCVGTFFVQQHLCSCYKKLLTIFSYKLTPCRLFLYILRKAVILALLPVPSLQNS